VNKTSSIHTQFRTFPLEVLATRAPEKHTATSLETCVSENGAQFHLDFSQVYWNSRLHTEHGRLVNSFPKYALVADVMCGIGPFALPAGKLRQSWVLANDLNPESYRWLSENVKHNGMDRCNPAKWRGPGHVDATCMDGREMIRQSLVWLNNNVSESKLACTTKANQLRAQNPEKAKDFDRAVEHWENRAPLGFEHFVMNLPASALGFLGLPQCLMLCFIDTLCVSISKRRCSSELTIKFHECRCVPWTLPWFLSNIQ
jgi:tRNA (guanine37-N1)-methyltransferase